MEKQDNENSRPSIENAHIYLSEKNCQRRVDVDEIVYLKADTSYCEIYKSDGTMICVSVPMGYVKNYLPEEQFIQVHKSHVVNRNFVYEIRDNRIILPKVMEESKLRIGDTFKTEFLERLTIVKKRNRKDAIWNKKSYNPLKVKPSKRFYVNVSDYLQKINSSEIVYLEAGNEHCKIHLHVGEQIVTSSLMPDIEDFLPKGQFIRIHQSFIVNWDCMDVIFGNNVMLPDRKTTLPIGEGNRPLVFQSMIVINSSHKKYQ